MHSLQLLFVDIKGYSIPDSFAKKGPNYGEAIPDLAFLQLNVRDVPVLRLATDLHILRTGTTVATAGFPLGEDALIIYEKLVQVTPFLRQGVVSSLHPFPCPSPDGFTIDILMQGGGSGSPVFLIDQEGGGGSPIFMADAPIVVGMVYAGFPNVNITLALPSTIISAAFESCLSSATLDFTGVPTLEYLYKNAAPNEKPNWETFVM